MEPENLPTVTSICRTIKTINDSKNIWIYTGYLYEDFQNLELFDYVDVVVDGKFIESEKDISLQFRGSKNQKIVDVKRSKMENEVKLW